jgi:hypothetical protein
LDLIADQLPKLLHGFVEPVDPTSVRHIQDSIGRAVTRVEASATDARRERLTRFVAEPDLAPLQRTLLRLRHDLVILGRASSEPLPVDLRDRLVPPLLAAGAAAAAYLHAAAEALRRRRAAPPLDDVNAAFDRYTEAVAQARRDSMTINLSVDAVEHLFSLGFALDQLRRNFADLERCTKDYGRPEPVAAGPAPAPQP